ncbi:RNA-binding motif, single-stranded-interacting protein 1 [Hypsizygus marmoreus]|uniref:RNA-binding motif, single-stranded-interacting protein 1 n=1 Tax=Hypsizygus marmoreus TaxID=39966 RepID=A0A369JAM0_HYPMA|nr:RNA-binding motif, single-stranded-interacting protein 1 [Hypsizygus marmoreus]
MRTAESQPTLIALGLPDYVDYEDLAEMFDDFAVKRIFLSDEDQSSQWAKFEFYSFDEAEKAYALTHLRTIPFIHDSWSLSLSIPWKPRLAGYPRFVKCLPQHTTELQLYEMLHPFGSMAYVRIFKDIGPVVEFWNDEDAMKAEVAVKRHFAGGLKITLQAYDPCVVFCINLNPGVDEESLILYSQKYGRVESARVLKRDGKSRGLGLVRFSSAEEAKYAKASLHGTTWQDKPGKRGTL